MKKHLVLIIVLYIISVNLLNSQIVNEIISYVDSTEQIINNGRKLIAQNIIKKDFNKINDIYLYLTDNIDDDNCSAFSFYEELVITCLTQNWNKWESLAKGLEDHKKRICYPNIYSINNVLSEELELQADSLSKIKKNVSEETTRLIDLFLYLHQDKPIDEEYNMRLKSIKKEFPHSEYQTFIQRSLPPPYTRGSLCFSIGPTQLFPTGNLSKVFSSNTIFHMSMDFNINKVYSSLYFSGGSLRAKIPLSFSSSIIDTTFESNARYLYTDYGILGGYFIARNNRFHLAPYASLSGVSLKTNLYTSTKEDEDKEFELINSFACGLGLHSEIKLFQLESRRNTPYAVKNHFSLKVDAGYNFITNSTDNLFSGNIYYIRSVIVWGIGDF